MAFDALNARKIKQQIERKQRAILKRSKKMLSSPVYIQVGWTNKSGKYPDGTKVVDVATIHEYGFGQSEKAFVRTTAYENDKKWNKLFLDLCKSAMAKRGGFLTEDDKHNILNTIGMHIRMDLQKTITDIDLIDTTRLKNSILIEFRRR